MAGSTDAVHAEDAFSYGDLPMIPDLRTLRVVDETCPSDLTTMSCLYHGRRHSAGPLPAMPTVSNVGGGGVFHLWWQIVDGAVAAWPRATASEYSHRDSYA
jgi:hypothetical protein